MSFSERYGYKPVKDVIQTESMDDDLRNSLWNALTICIWDDISKSLRKFVYWRNADEDTKIFIISFWANFFKVPVDTIPDNWTQAYDQIRTEFFNYRWNEVYDFIQFTIGNLTKARPKKSDLFNNAIKQVLKNELSGYSLIGGEITPITSKEEIKEIEDALNLPNPLSPVKTHISDALHKLSDRKKPDYRNAIKESISAVESLCKIIVKEDKATLPQAINILEKSIHFHPAFKIALEKLYGYTSDEGGVRHSLMDEDKIDFEDAKFMLVSCSTFVNYLVVKSSKAGIKF
jgi:hypothetical protein